VIVVVTFLAISWRKKMPNFIDDIINMMS